MAKTHYYFNELNFSFTKCKGRKKLEKLKDFFDKYETPFILEVESETQKITLFGLDVDKNPYVIQEYIRYNYK